MALVTRIRFGDIGSRDAVVLPLPPRKMWPIRLAFGAFFAVFAAIDWTVISGIRWTGVRDVADLVFVLFQGFWVLEWSVGVALLGALTVLVFFYKESAQLSAGTLVYASRLGPLAFPVEYELAKVRNLRLDPAGSASVRLRFDYGDGATTLGDTMSPAEGQRLIEGIRSSIVDRPSSIVVAPPRTNDSAVRPSTMDDGRSSVSAVALAAALIAAPFFIGHFGGFMAMHFLFIYLFFVRGTTAGPNPLAGETLRAIFVGSSEGGL